MRFWLGLGVASLCVGACGRSGMLSYEDQDFGADDLAVPVDLAGRDFGVRDIGEPPPRDLGGRDFSLVRDFAQPPPDLSQPPPRDLSVPPQDFSQPRDFSLADLAGSDLSRPPADLAVATDLSRPPADLSQPPADLANLCPSGVVCNDNNPCTVDFCDISTGTCVFAPVPNGAACPGASACQQGVCFNGGCVQQPRNCADGNPCTFDFCSAAQGGCVHVALPNGSFCNDNNPCTVRDRCQAGVCSGNPRNCDDANSCTVDSCNPANGNCIHTAGPNGALCDDNNPCSTSDTCMNGTCVGGPPAANGTSCIVGAGVGCCEVGMCCLGAACGCP